MSKIHRKKFVAQTAAGGARRVIEPHFCREELQVTGAMLGHLVLPNTAKTEMHLPVGVASVPMAVVAADTPTLWKQRQGRWFQLQNTQIHADKPFQ